MAPTVLPVVLTMIQLVIPVGIGVALRRLSGSDGVTFRSYSKLVVNVALPLYFFVRIARIDLGEIVGGVLFPVAAIVHIGLGLVLGRLSVALFRKYLTPEARRVAVGAGSFGNSGYMPLSIHELLPTTLPAAVALFGNDLPTLYIGAYILMQSPLLWSIGNWLISGRAERPRLREFISGPVLGILAGVAAALVGVDVLLETTGTVWYAIGLALDRIAGLTVPLVLITLGGLIGGLKVPRGDMKSATVMSAHVTLVRLVLMPGVFWLIAWATRDLAVFSVPVLWVLFLEFHTPPANNLGVMAARAGQNENEVALTMMVTYILYGLVFPLYLGGFLSFVGH